ncbi:MAG: phosphoribosylamine---glycine ligase [Methanobacterium sp.]|jgi:phosphoribosylamine--glycine ligase|uniref:phosphoribosylamine--glycine ligase n=1 Tax=Methanobacterium sp. TaxID=2164 RepID=UPI0003C94F3A|nr:phosphoribosylamine--glycine ligase [Methanobacterium sp.]MDI3548911.1 phosphoribosylamine---glycine ligase [Methanobacterium sp.]CDG66131.1 Phosphoribosylamine-glycine ligase [Methanobacterium sp. MB1]
MKILVIGTGAREHAICQALYEEADIYSIMSNHNPGIARISQFKVGSEMDIEGVKKYAQDQKVDLAIIGPEAPLEHGIVDSLQDIGVPCVGPTQQAARIETDKAFMRELFANYNIPGSIAFGTFDTVEDAAAFIDDFGEDVVVKPVGLTGGKGVKIVGEHLKDSEDAKNYVKEIIDNKIGGHASVVIEERLIGEEFTVQALVDGDHLIPMPAAQDHPHAYEGDKGPITGGMGSYSDKNGLLPFMDSKDYDAAVEVMEKTIDALKKEGSPYKGVLYGQFMLCHDGPKLVEYNARFGDPEAMNVLPLLETSMVDLCQGVVDGNLKKAKFKPQATVCKYLVPNGYPDSGKAGQPISVDEEKIKDEGAMVFYAAVNQKDGNILTTGSRALGLVSLADSIEEAEKQCERATQYVQGDLYHRSDVGTEKLIAQRIQHMQEIRKQ